MPKDQLLMLKKEADQDPGDPNMSNQKKMEN